MKRSYEERWIFPSLFTADEDKVACVYSQCCNIIDEFVKFDLFRAEFVQVSQPLSVVLGHKTPRPDFQAGDCWLESRHVSQVVGISVVLQLVCCRKVCLSIKAYGELEDIKRAGFPVYEHYVGSVLGYEAGGDGNRAARSCFVARDVDIELKLLFVQDLRDVIEDPVVPPCEPW